MAIVGAQPRLKTNPIAYAVPASKMQPLLFNVAPTQVAGNKIRLARRVGAGLIPNWVAGPDGTVIDKETDGIPDEYFMLPFGGTRENGSHKGYAFAAVVDIMTGQLSGAGPGFIQQKTAHYFQAWKIDAFMDTEKFKDDMDDFLEGLANTKPAPGQERDRKSTRLNSSPVVISDAVYRLKKKNIIFFFLKCVYSLISKALVAH